MRAREVSRLGIFRDGVGSRGCWKEEEEGERERGREEKRAWGEISIFSVFWLLAFSFCFLGIVGMKERGRTKGEPGLGRVMGWIGCWVWGLGRVLDWKGRWEVLGRIGWVVWAGNKCWVKDLKVLG